jgi:hypothetical protein
MKYTPGAFELLGYTYRGTKRQDFIGNIMPLWYKMFIVNFDEVIAGSA